MSGHEKRERENAHLKAHSMTQLNPQTLSPASLSRISPYPARARRRPQLLFPHRRPPPDAPPPPSASPAGGPCACMQAQLVAGSPAGGELQLTRGPRQHQAGQLLTAG